MPDFEQVFVYRRSRSRCLGRIVPTFINDKFKPSYNRYNIRFQIALDIMY